MFANILAAIGSPCANATIQTTALAHEACLKLIDVEL
jgi:hypothetical protein